MTAETGTRQTLSVRLRAVPLSPGVYMWRDAEGKILYVGKASALRNRMRSYVGKPSSLAPKTRRLMERAVDFDYIVTESEQEALLLENSLIKRHQPRFNARLRDDKTYPYIKIDLAEEFPQIYITRKTSDDGARYFGPFASAGSVRKTLALLKRLFPYRSCTKAITGTDDRPCLDYHIKRCIGPCIGVASKTDYAYVIDQVILFLEGRTADVVGQIRGQMASASDDLNFERAAILRDQLRAIEKVYEGQKVLSMSGENLDVVAAAHGRDEAWIEVFFVRHGKLIGRDNFMMSNTRELERSEILTDFVKQFYDSAAHVPRRILLEDPIEDAEVIETWLSEKRGGKVDTFVPKRGEKRKLVLMVAENAGHGLERMKAKWAADSELMGGAMEELQEQLSLPNPPVRMECYDVSHIQGTNTVASMVVFQNGKPLSSHYRRFKIKTVEGNDDFASMREVLTRRFKRLQKAREEATNGTGPESPDASEKKAEKAGDDSFGAVPDLVLIDGGKGHLSAAVQVFLDLGIRDIPLASLAKREEEIFIPQDPDPILLPRNSKGLFLVQRIRDEAHRFAVTFHRKRRQKSSIQSALDLIPGVGPKRKRMLIRQFGSLKGVREATTEEIAAAPGMTLRLAEKIKEYV
ncbi:MAG: excinuclease ABC subunit UvrC [Chloroflexi bacterium]|nr:excinuclease ABC subunit UvrC [Chloroflexota bacterium]